MGAFGAIDIEAIWPPHVTDAQWKQRPSQIEIANRVFAPNDDEIAEAQAVIAAVSEAEAHGLGAATHNGMMIDAATTRLFQVTLDRAKQCGLI